MAGVNEASDGRLDATFNSAVEVGLRALCVLTAAFSAHHSLQRLTIYDYLVVHYSHGVAFCRKGCRCM